MTLEEKINRLLLAAVWINGHARLGSIVITTFRGHSYLPAKKHSAAVERFDGNGELVEETIVRAESQDLVHRAAMAAAIAMEERNLGHELEFQDALACLDDLKNLDMQGSRPGDCLRVGSVQPATYCFDPDSMLPVDEETSVFDFTVVTTAVEREPPRWPLVVKANTGHEAGRWTLLPMKQEVP